MDEPNRMLRKHIRIEVYKQGPIFWLWIFSFWSRATLLSWIFFVGVQIFLVFWHSLSQIRSKIHLHNFVWKQNIIICLLVLETSWELFLSESGALFFTLLTHLRMFSDRTSLTGQPVVSEKEYCTIKYA